MSSGVSARLDGGLLWRPRSPPLPSLTGDRSSWCGTSELTAGEIGSHFEVSRPAVSQHLQILKNASLVTERRQGTKQFYQAHDESLVALRTFLEVLLGEGTYIERRLRLLAIKR